MIEGKKQSIPLPWKIGECIVKHITHLDELERHHEKLGSKEAKFVKGFEPNKKFTTHMESIRYYSYFTKFEQFQEGGGDNLDICKIASDQVSDDMEETNSTNEVHKQHGRELVDKNPNSPIKSQKSTP